MTPLLTWGSLTHWLLPSSYVAQVGGATLRPWSERQWEKSFAAALSALPGESEDTEPGGDDSSDSDSEPADDAVAQPHAAVPVGRDGIAASASAHELALAKELAKDPWGRFGGREGKMARIAAAEAAHAASLGDAATKHVSKRQRAAQEAAAAAAEAAAEAARVAASEMPYPGSSKSKRSRGHDARGEPERGKKPRVGTEETRLAQQDPPPAAAQDAPGASQHWWSDVFRFAGALEGALHPRAAAGVADMQKTAQTAAFTGTEAEQIALCEAAHAHKASGRRGLGQGRQAAEPEWHGKRIIFDDPQPAKDDDEGTAKGDDALARVKWKKVAASVLARHPQGKMKEAKLRKATIRAVTEALGGYAAASRDVLTAWFERRVLTSSKFSRTACGRVVLSDGAD